MSRSTIYVVADSVAVSGNPGDLVSLLPLGGDATGVTTDGLRWSLAGETLAFGASRGVSNELVDTTATITLDGGVLAVVVEGHDS